MPPELKLNGKLHEHKHFPGNFKLFLEKTREMNLDSGLLEDSAAIPTVQAEPNLWFFAATLVFKGQPHTAKVKAVFKKYAARFVLYLSNLRLLSVQIYFGS